MAKKIPLRMCVGCQEMVGKNELIRVVRIADQEFVLDATGKKNGRGAYICKKQDCLAKAVKNRGLERSFKTQIPKDIVAELQKEMEKLGE